MTAVPEPSEAPRLKAEALRDFAVEVDRMAALTNYAKAEFVVDVPDATLALLAARTSYEFVASRARSRADEIERENEP